MKVRLVTLQRSGSGSSYRIYAQKNLDALRSAGIDASIDWLPGAGEARHGGVIRPTLSHFFRSFPNDGVFRHATEPNTAFRRVDVVTIHDLYPFLDRGMMYRAFQAVTRSSARRARLIVTQVEVVRREIGARIGEWAERKTRIVPPPFPIPEPGRRSPEHDLVWIGNLDPRKHAGRFLSELGKVTDVRWRVVFLCHGATSVTSGPFRDALDAAGRSHDLTVIDRSISPGELEGLYRSSLCVVSTSSLEGYHNPPMEGWARGTPAALPDIPLYREIYGTVPGIFYYDPAGSFDEAARRAIAKGPHIPDPGLLHSVSYPSIGRRLGAVYAELGA